MGRTGRKEFRRNQFLARPNSGKRIESVGQSFAEHDDVRRDAQVLDGPEFSRAIKPHLDFIIHNEDFMLVAGFFEAKEIFFGWNYVAAGSLHRLDIKRAVLRSLCLGIPDRIIFIVKKFGELVLAIDVARFALQAVHATEAIRVEHKVGAVAKVAVAAAVAVTGSDGGSAQRSAVIPAHKSKHQVLARDHANNFERIFNGLGPAHIEMDAALHSKALLAILGRSE